MRSFLTLSLMFLVVGQTTPVLAESLSDSSLSPDKPIEFKQTSSGKDCDQQSSLVSASPQLHKVQMRLAGSPCLSCLMELEKKLKGIKGVVKAKVEYLGDNVFHYQALPSSQAMIVYDQAQLSLEAIKSFLKFQGYHAFKVIDKLGP